MATNITTTASYMPNFRLIGSLSIILLSLALVLGLPGNSFVVWSILTQMRRRSVTALLVLNLALADLAVLLTAPFFLHFLAHGSWSFGLTGCRLCHYICGVSMYASVLFITVMSLDRSLAVARPFLSQKFRTKAAAWRVLVGIWVVSAILAVPVIVYRKVTGEKGKEICAANYTTPGHIAFHLLFESITGFVLPFVAIVGSYSDIGRRLRATRFRRSRRTGRLVVLIILTFAIFWLPYHAVNLGEASRALSGYEIGKGAAGQRLKAARYVLIALAFLSSSLNPLLYACAGGGLLRSAGVGFVAKLLEGTGSEVSSTRRGGTQVLSPRGNPNSPQEPGPAEEGLTLSTNPID
ncbi:leukotriene B4 receptor 1 [Monodelphis domestica]|uniref:Leukotriene B4 receptor n=1 Tax=Monodelphis domestica TaxID=13616 RepID=F6Q0D9_MONDO|nr:leukotriene B4 receptor 1 [Monodelphis domestica]